MPKVASKKKTTEPTTSRSRPAKQRDRVDRFDLRDEEDDGGLFVSQSPSPPARAPRRMNANRPAKLQLSVSRMDEGDGFGLDIEKYEKAQSKRAAAGRKPNRAFDEFDKLVKGQNSETGKEIKDVSIHHIDREQSFSKTFCTTFTSINNDGISASRTVANHHCLRDAAKEALSKAHTLLQDSRSSVLALSFTDATAFFREIHNNYAFDVQHTERVLEIGMVVGDDKINHRLSGLLPKICEPDYNDASEALFAAEDEGETGADSWARVAKDQGRIVKRMAVAMAK